MPTKAIDLFEEFNQAMGGTTRAQSLLIDLDVLGHHLAEAMAEDIRNNLSRGIQPDGSGAMPPRKKDGKGRGEGTAVAQSIRARKEENRYIIAADTEEKGEGAKDPRVLKKLLDGVPLAPDWNGPALQRVIANAVELATGKK